MRRLKILLVPDLIPWVLGTWAKQIASIGKTHDYFIFSQEMINRHPHEWSKLVKDVDVVHFLNQFGVKDLSIPDHVAIVNSVHHIVNDDEWKNDVVALLQAEAVMVVANEWKEYILSRSTQSDNIHLFYNGVDTGKFHPFPDRQIARNDLGIVSDRQVIGYSAKFSSDYAGRKGVDVFLETLRLLADRKNYFNIAITGPGWDEVIQQVTSYGHTVNYYPFLQDRLMPTFYNALDMYISTSRIEGGPVPIIESMACGIPVLTTPVGLVKDFLRHEHNALVVSKDDPEATADAIHMLSQAPRLHQRLSSAGLQTIQQQLTWEKTLNEIEDLYEQAWRKKSYCQDSSQKNMSLIPERQRAWATNIDSHAWHERLYRQGYRKIGMSGMVNSILNSRGIDLIKLTKRTLSAIGS
jgi:glycosyltransferase involved in cell wall biosynthesis